VTTLQDCYHQFAWLRFASSGLRAPHVRAAAVTSVGPTRRRAPPVGEPPLTKAFIGRWLITPDSTNTRSGEPKQDRGAHWGVALTKKGRYAVYVAHDSDNWPAQLRDFDRLEDAELPEDILALAKAELGQEHVIRLDI
jgi:hypothetical protein